MGCRRAGFRRSRKSCTWTQRPFSHAVTKANNLLAAMLDNHLQHGNVLGIDPRQIVLRRLNDLNDRALRDIINIRLFGVEPVVALNRFPDDRPEDLAWIIRFCSRQGVQAVVAEHYARGGEGGDGLAHAGTARDPEEPPAQVALPLPLEMPLERKDETLVRKLYGVDGVDFDAGARHDLDLLDRHGFSELPICMAKMPMSMSDVPGDAGGRAASALRSTS